MVWLVKYLRLHKKIGPIAFKFDTEVKYQKLHKKIVND